MSLRRLARPSLPLAVRLRRLVVHVPDFGGSASALDPPPLPEFPFCAGLEPVCAKETDHYKVMRKFCEDPAGFVEATIAE